MEFCPVNKEMTDKVIYIKRCPADRDYFRNSIHLFFPVICYPYTVLHQLDQKIIYPHHDFKHLTEKYFEIGMKLNDFSIQLVKYWYRKNPIYSYCCIILII